MKFLQLGSKASDIFVAVYIIGFLLFRLTIEDQFGGRYVLSMFFGIVTLLFLWALIQNKILNPTYFGLFDKKVSKQKKP